MSKKKFNLIAGITGGVCTIATAAVTYSGVPYAVQIVAGIGIIEIAIIECASLFVKTEEK